MADEMRSIKCREHGGVFRIPNGRGRPPAKCKPENKCRQPRGSAAQATANGKVARDAAAIAAAVRRAVPATATVTERASAPAPVARRTRAKAPESPVEATETNNPSLTKAQEAKAQLEPLGWSVNGRAWVDDDGSQCASVLGNRNTETISLVWRNGTVTTQEYILWDRERPSLNFKGMPKRNLNFNPDEMSDRELVATLSGMSVTWWNRLAKGTEHAVIPDRVTIEHAYNSRGDETPGERIIKFVDRNGSGYRAFYVAALIKVG